MTEKRKDGTSRFLGQQGGSPKETAYERLPQCTRTFAREVMQDYDGRVQWAAVAVILLLVGGMIFAAAYAGGETQMANIGATVETGGSTATMPAPIR